MIVGFIPSRRVIVRVIYQNLITAGFIGRQKDEVRLDIIRSFRLEERIAESCHSKCLAVERR